MPRSFTRLVIPLLRPGFFACIVLLVMLSWLPSTAMVRTGADGHIEHATAYFLTATIMALAYREAPRLGVQFVLLVTLAAVMEVGQAYVPGRTSSVLDFAASSAGVAAGSLLMSIARSRVLNWLGIDGDLNVFTTRTQKHRS
jgi:hypothetical protein